MQKKYCVEKYQKFHVEKNSCKKMQLFRVEKNQCKKINFFMQKKISVKKNTFFVQKNKCVEKKVCRIIFPPKFRVEVHKKLQIVFLVGVQKSSN